MANMSYCRFENTANDLADCRDALMNGEAEDSELSSEYERRGKVRLLKLCKEIAEDYADVHADCD